MTSDDTFEAAKVLASLRVSPSELGYRVQALFAEVLSHMGARIEAVARVGHPDVTAQLGGRMLLVQVKATGQGDFTLCREDLEGIRPGSDDQVGYLALLDLGPPIAWICVEYVRAQKLVHRTVPLALMKSMDDAEFSVACTEACVKLLMEQKSSIEGFTFSLMRKRALASGT